MWKKKTSGSTEKAKSCSGCCQSSKSGKINFLTSCSPFQPRGRSHLAWLSGYKLTNKLQENRQPWRVADVSGKIREEKKVPNFPKNVKLTCSLLMALSTVCTILVFTKVLCSSVCFNTSQGFFSFWGGGEMHFSKFKPCDRAPEDCLQPLHEQHSVLLGGPVL